LLGADGQRTCVHVHVTVPTALLMCQRLPSDPRTNTHRCVAERRAVGGEVRTPPIRRHAAQLVVCR
jgi:hypothetical protein